MKRRSIRAAVACTAVGFIGFTACTGRDTGSIDLYGPATSAPTGPGKPPPPKKPTPCVGDADCPKGEPLCSALSVCVQCFTALDCHDVKHPACFSQTGACVECDLAAPCRDAAKPLCDLSSGKCVACATDADCPVGWHCDKDALCHG